MPSFDFPEIPIEDSSTRKNEEGFNPLRQSSTHSIKIIVPGEPVPKGRPRARIVDSKRYAHAKRFVSFYQPVETKQYENQVGAIARQVMRGRGNLIGALRLEMVAYLEPPPSWSAVKKEKAYLGMILPTSRPDADNYLKIIDACNGLVWKDDAQIVKMSVEKRYDENPRLEIEIFAV